MEHGTIHSRVRKGPRVAPQGRLGRRPDRPPPRHLPLPSSSSPPLERAVGQSPVATEDGGGGASSECCVQLRAWHTRAARSGAAGPVPGDGAAVPAISHGRASWELHRARIWAGGCGMLQPAICVRGREGETGGFDWGSGRPSPALGDGLRLCPVRLWPSLRPV